MDLPDWLKAQVTIPTILYLLGIASIVLYLLKKNKAALIVLTAAFTLFLICSTGYLPRYLIQRLESHATPFTKLPADHQEKECIIHVLGGGYSLSSGLPPNVQLGSHTLGRLIEGVRIHKLIPQSILVTSGYSALGFESQASVVRKAALMLGVDSSKIEMLETPTNTWEEAEALKAKFNNDKVVIVVTDAVHLPRAVAFFKEQGLIVIGAPSSFIIVPNSPEKKLKWLPSLTNIEMSNIILREYLGKAKGYILN